MDIFDKAIKLYKNCKSLSSYKEDFLVKIVDADEAYKIQDEFINIKKSDLSDSIGGWKVALTNPVMQ